jgi:hypothetical protein
MKPLLSALLFVALLSSCNNGGITYMEMNELKEGDTVFVNNEITSELEMAIILSNDTKNQVFLIRLHKTGTDSTKQAYIPYSKLY